MKKISVRAYSFIAVLIVVAIAMIADHRITASYNQAVLEDVQINLSEIEALLKNEYASYRDDILFLYSTPPISGLTRALSNNGIDTQDNTTTAQWLSRLTYIFRSFVENNSAYSQLRLLDAQGNETIRVDRKNGKIVAVEEHQLQPKSDRYYFNQTRALVNDQLYVSHIDLNRENGRLTFPHQPTVRLALKIESEGQFIGMLVANIAVSHVLTELDVLVGQHLSIVLTDDKYYFIKHPNQALRFSRDLAPERTFTSEYQAVDSDIKGLHRYVNRDTGDAELGSAVDIFVAPGEAGVLHAYVMVDDDYYHDQLIGRRIESLAGLAAVLILAVLALEYLGNNNKRLAKLLVVAEEAKAAVDVAEDAVITVASDWRVNTYNRAFERMFLLQESDISGHKMTDILTRLGGREIAASFEAHLGTGLNGAEWYRPTGTTSGKWYYCKVNTLDNPQAGAAYAIVIRDITVEKESLLTVAETNRQLEEQVEERTQELKKTRDEALQLSQLKTNFISTISHEMRTPLNGIVGATTLLKSESLNAKQSKLLSMAENSVDTLKRLINDILDLSKIEAGKLELDFRNFNPEAMIEGITSTMSVVANQKGIGFYIDTSELNFSLVHSDPHRLSQVINNVLNNAIKFTSEGYVLVRCLSEVERDDACLVVEVTDTGKGISPRQQEKLFTAFSQADETIAASYGGTGLGLSICREILALLQGSITVSSREGEGSTFTIRLPLKLWQVREPQAQPRLAGCVAGMLVDNKTLGTVLRRLLVSNGALPEALEAPVSLVEVQACACVFIDPSNPDYATFTANWLRWVADKERLPLLFVIASGAASVDEALPQATVLTEPLYRSVFLSNVIDSREKRTPSTVLSADNRRSSDIADDPSQERIDFSRNTFLIVDDNEINRQVAEFILEPYGPKVLTAVNGQVAIEQLLSNPDTDLVLMDCNMPELNGYDATRAIRQGAAGDVHRNIPVIAMTANALKGESEKCYDAGMNEYLTKPIEAGEFIQKVKRCMEHSDTGKQPNQDPKRPEQTLWQCEETLVRLADNKALLKKLLAMYLNESQVKLAAIEQAIAADDREKVRFTAHALKGNSAEIGAASLQDKLAALESLAQTASKREIEGLFDEISDQMPHLISLLEQFIKEGQ